jgi:hypothetical protein
MQKSWLHIKVNSAAFLANIRIYAQKYSRLALVAAAAVLILIIWLYLHPYLQGLASRQTDSWLARALYIVGGALALAGWVVSVNPPIHVRWKITCGLIFMFLVYAGFVVQSEQVSRIEVSATNAENARKAYGRDVISLRSEIASLHGEIEGTQNTIATVAKNWPDRTQWEALVSKVDKTPHGPTIVIPSPSSGNLKERAVALSNKLIWIAKRRDDLFDQAYKKNINPGENLVAPIQRWAESNFSYYQWCCEKDVDALVTEFAGLHLKDERLEQDISMIKSMEKFRTLGQRAWLDSHKFSDIGERLKALSNMMP